MWFDNSCNSSDSDVNFLDGIVTRVTETLKWQRSISHSRDSITQDKVDLFHVGSRSPSRKEDRQENDSSVGNNIDENKDEQGDAFSPLKRQKPLPAKGSSTSPRRCQPCRHLSKSTSSVEDFEKRSYAPFDDNDNRPSPINTRQRPHNPRSCSFSIPTEEAMLETDTEFRE